jgi:hypothetical protein
MTGVRNDTMLALARESGCPSISHPSPALPRLASIGRDEATDLYITVNANIPDNGFAQRIAEVSNDRALGHLPPHAVNWYPVASGTDVIDRSMPVGNIAANNASRAAHALEPSANVIRDIFKLSVIDCASNSRDEDQRSEYEQERTQSHHDSPHTDDLKDTLVSGRRPLPGRPKMLSHRNISYRQTALVKLSASSLLDAIPATILARFSDQLSQQGKHYREPAA